MNLPKKIEGLVWEAANVDRRIMPEYPTKRSRGAIVKGNKTTYYWFCYAGLMYLAGKTENGKDILEHAEMMANEEICAMPYKTGSKEYMEACKLYKLKRDENGNLYIPGFENNTKMVV